MRICSIDVGTNTVNSIVADVEGGRLTVLVDEERFARLGQGVDAAGRLAPEAMDRVVDCLASALARAARLSAERVVIGATSASRDAANVGDLQARVARELGLDYRVISGETEARLSFAGALALRPDLDRAVVLDVGGGSTEVVAGDRAGIHTATSLDVGTVRLTERHGAVPPVDAATQRAVEADVEAALATLPPGVFAHGPLVGTGSTAKVAAHLAGGDRVTPEALARSRAHLATLAPEAIAALAPDVLTGREDVMVSALVLVETVLRVAGAPALLVSPGGLRHGLALSEGRGEKGKGGETV